jgi:glutaredoxin
MFMNFAVYTRTGCPYCTKIKQVLEGKGYNFREYRLGVDFERDAFYNQFGNGSTFPQVVLNSTNLGGCTETVQYLRENNLI